MSNRVAPQCRRYLKLNPNTQFVTQNIGAPRALYPKQCQTYATTSERLPAVAQPSLWHSITPKALRQPRGERLPAKSGRKKKWNPATFFIWILLLIGSNAIQMLTLRNNYSSFNRKADQKIALLREVLERVQRGEKVDVEKVLGTGDEVAEQEWKDVIKNIEEEDHLWAAKDRRREKRQMKKEQAAADRKSETTTNTGKEEDEENELEDPPAEQTKRPPSFY